MPHQNPTGIDYTIAVFIVHQGRILLVNHRQEGKWLAPGGHIEPNETPDEAVHREVLEETGLEVELISQKPTAPFVGGDHELLTRPEFTSIHRVSSKPGHRHLVLVYFARSSSDQVVLAEREHSELRWFDRAELADPIFGVPPDIKWFCEQALGQETK